MTRPIRVLVLAVLLLLVLTGWPVLSQQSDPAVPASEFTNSIGMKFVRIAPGTFLMGSDSGDEKNTKPVHEVTLTEGFYMQVTEVTQKQWQAFMGDNPSAFKGPDLPVEQVSWEDAQEFLKKLNATEKGANYRLPSEAEWEYAARAGQTGELPDLEAVAWSTTNSGKQTHPVGQKEANEWGLYDMLGNVWEWCADWYDYDYYKKSPSVDPSGPSSGKNRVERGGSWEVYVAMVERDLGGGVSFTFNKSVIHVAVRGGARPTHRSKMTGFRCVRESFP